ncbi:uncharacterized protein TRIADDRAFT_29561 [Trichoplax adhaerens]|uniref:G-protein coupled receptors family 3 profile domain-containing protein n=1 Tax=Trichoplax adhaerens TaxID=10228 RepID=B3S600_TRIAD|nr:hypothetical protein TRIADDRAFT_29561 [Trichoplax adhaerens]EDV22006.1 hypothetical protein TRIADDRAFT_29561 [Trichoplax adhaerens]|eukprot:XP_002115643.1 hypothetical protein TRIADDRAFT_29561 [Trichoplax adhaerens]
MQAMIYAIDELVNRNPKLLPGLKVGWTLIDSCKSRELAMASLEYHFRKSNIFQLLSSRNLNYANLDPFVRTLQYNLNNTVSSEPPIIGVIGEDSDHLTIPLAYYTSSFRVIQITYNSRTTALSSGVMCPYFYRTSISYKQQAEAIADIISNFNWNWVSVIVTGSTIDREFSTTLLRQFSFKKICVANNIVISNNYTQSDMISAIQNLKKTIKSKVVILTGNNKIIYALLKQAQSQRLTGITWIGTYNWLTEAQIANISSDIIRGAISIDVNKKIIRHFDDYLRKLNLCDSHGNPWLFDARKEISKSATANCKYGPQMARILKRTFYVPQSFTAFIMDAVLALAYSLHHKLGCTNTSCPALNAMEINRDREQLNHCLRNIQFQGVSSDLIHFNSDGSSGTGFNFVNYQNVYINNLQSLSPIVVGNWSKENGLTINSTKIVWNSNKTPTSRCSRDCKPGYRVNHDSSLPLKLWTCCWNCRKCSRYSISTTYNQLNCSRCRNFFYSNSNGTQCISYKVLRFNWRGAFAILFYIISSLCVIKMIFTWVVIYVYRNTPVIKGSNYPLMNLLLFWYAICILTAGVFLAPDNSTLCQIRLILINITQIGTSVTIICRVNQVALIFHRGFKNNFQNLFTKTRTQIILIFTVLTVTSSIILLITQIQPVNILKIELADNTMDLMCDYSSSPALICIIVFWLATLILSCYLAFRIRSLPGNYNESKNIAAAVLMYAAIDMIGFPAFLSTTGRLRKLIGCSVALFYGIVTNACYFLPKLYIIFFQPESNTREQAMVSIAEYNFSKVDPNSKVSAILVSFNKNSSTSSPLELRKKVTASRIQPQNNSITETEY